MKAVTDFLGEGGVGVSGKNPDLVVHDRSVTFQVEKILVVGMSGIERQDCRDRNSLKCKFLQYRRTKVNHKYMYPLDCVVVIQRKKTAHVTMERF